LLELEAALLRVGRRGVALDAGKVQISFHVEPFSDERMKKRMSARNRRKAIVLIGGCPA
jgi:hypothetical protein